MGMDGKASQGGSGGPNRLRAGERFTSVHNYNRKKNVHRATFLDEMIRLLPNGTGEGKVTFRKRLADVVDLGAAGVDVQFTDGTTGIADAVIGCDGVKSPASGKSCCRVMIVWNPGLLASMHIEA